MTDPVRHDDVSSEHDLAVDESSDGDLIRLYCLIGHKWSASGSAGWPPT